jgi:hypothetical protein
MSLSSVATKDLIAEVLSRVDSVAYGISRTGQEVPMSVEALAEGWGSIIDMHVFASQGKGDRQRIKIGRHMVSSCLKFYLSCMDSTHRMFLYRDFCDSVAETFAKFVRHDDVGATDEDKLESQRAYSNMINIFMKQMLPLAMEKMASNPMGTIESWVQTASQDSNNSSLEDILAMFRS